jgi:hypothetical protein
MTRLSRLLFLLCFSLPAAANAAIEMQLSAGLGGQAVAGRSTELKVRIFANSPVVAELQINDADGFFSAPVTLDAQTEKSIWFPVTPEPTGPLKVRLLSNSGEIIEKELVFEHGNAPLTIISRSVPASRSHGGLRQTPGVRPVIIPPESLPRSLQGYAGIHAIVTDVGSLSSLTIEQYRAFANYLSACNILLLSAASTAVLERVRGLSGCGGKFVQSYRTLAEVSRLLQTLDSKRSVKPPSAQSLLPLQLPLFQASMTTPLILYLAGYIFLMALLSWRMKKSQYLLILPVVAALAGILAWSGSGSARLLSWAETRSGDSHLRVSSLLLLGGDRRGENRLTYDADISISPFGDNTRYKRARKPDKDARRELSAYTSLLTPAAYQLSSVGRHAPAFTLQLKQGLPELVYHAEKTTNQARLLWRGYTYRVPPLAKGESWNPHETQKQISLSAEEKLLQRHLQHDLPALLLPFTPGLPGVAAARLQNQGWLVIRHSPEQIL